MILRLFAPFLPYCTEEAWSWWQSGLIHRARWPSGPALARSAGMQARPEMWEVVSGVLMTVRRTKTEAKGSMRTRVKRCVVTGAPSLLELVALASEDLRDAGAISQLDLLADPQATALAVSVELAEHDPNPG